MQVYCGNCKRKIALYQKVGRGNILRMYLNRIIESSVDLTNLPEKISCLNCKQHIADKIFLKDKNEIAYRMMRSTYNVQEQH